MDFTVQRRETLDPQLEVIRNMLRGKSSWSNVDTRLIIIEDISPRLIKLLGATFTISPEFFEEHLHRSGYYSDEANEQSPQAWNTSSLRKSYVSVKWCRPVNRWRQEPFTRSERNALLQSGSAELQGTFKPEAISPSITLDYTTTTMTNIFRPEFAMSTDPEGVIPKTAPAGWEERATMCTVKLDQVRYGLS